MQQNRRSIAHLLKHHKGILNALTVQYALYPNAASLAALSISPDWLKTDLGGPNADLRLFNIHMENTEKKPCLGEYDGTEIPW